MTSTRPARTLLGAGFAALVLTLTACGGDDDEGAATTTADTSAETTVDTATTDASGETTAASTSGTGTAASEPADRDAFVEAGLATVGTGMGEVAPCVIEAVIDGFGVDGLNEAGVTPEELWGPGAPLADAGYTPESPEITAVAEGIGACEGLMASFAASSGGTVPESEVTCMEDAGAAELVGQLLAYGLIDADTEALAAQGDELANGCGLGD